MIVIVTSVIGLSVALIIVLLIRGDRLRVANGVAWLLAASAMAGLGFAPGLFDYLSSYVGVAYPPALAFSIAFALVIVKLLMDDIGRTKLQVKQTRLLQRLALLEYEVKRLNEIIGETKEPESEDK